MHYSWILWTLALAQPLFSGAPNPGPEWEDKIDHPAIEKAALDYVDGFYECDADRVARGVHPSLQKVVVESIPGGRELLDFMDQAILTELARLGVGKKPPQERKIEVGILDVHENTAVVSIDSVDFLDHAQVAEING